MKYVSKFIALLLVAMFCVVIMAVPSMVLAWILLKFFPQITLSYTQLTIIIIIVSSIVRSISNRK